MSVKEAINTSSIITTTSLLIGVSVFWIAFVFLRAILEMDEYRIAAWHREETRWQTLRNVSSIFRSLQRWIVGVSQILEQQFPWFVALPKPVSASCKLGVLFFKVFFGDSNRLSQAVRICSSVAPWNAAEVAACGIIFSTFAFAFAALGTISSETSFRSYLFLVGVWFGAYRVWCYRFISSGENRRRTVRRFLPHAMDSIAMVMSSGGTFRAGMDSVIRDFPEQPLSQEFIRLRNELDRGQIMTQALQAIASSICLPEFDEMVRVLARVHQHGTPGSDAFVRLSKQLRVSHLRHMEEEVGRAEATMAMPTMLVMASCMVVAVAPFILSILNSSFFSSIAGR